MKLNKTFGRIATTLVATAMLASVAAVPAFAEDVDIATDGTIKNQTTGLTEVSFTKVYRMPENVTVPTNISFTYSVSTGTLDANETKSEGEHSIPVKTSTASVQGDTIASADFSKDPSDTDPTIDTYLAEVTLTLPSADDFAEPGVYKYTVSERVVGDTNDDVTPGGAHTLYVYVENGDSGKVITGVEFWDAKVSDDPEDVSKKTNKWVNYYKLNGNPDKDDDEDEKPSAKANEMFVTKTVTGDMADLTESFEFDIAITNPANPVSAYLETKKTVAGEEVWEPSENPLDSLEDIMLNNNTRVHIYGLSNGDAYTVTENAANSDGYVTTIDGSSTENGVKSGSFANSNVTVAYTNTRDAVSPTGLIMDIAPYVLLVVVAAAGCFVFLRKRRED